MAFNHGVAATLSIGGTAFAGYIDSVDAAFTRALAEIRTLGATAVARVAGLEDFSFTVNGAFDATADAVLYTLFHGSAAGVIVFQPDGTTNYTVSCWMPQYSIKVSSDAAATWTIQLASSGDCVRS